MSTLVKNRNVGNEISRKVTIARELYDFTKKRIGEGALTAEFEQYALFPESDLVQANRNDFDEFFNEMRCLLSEVQEPVDIVVNAEVHPAYYPDWMLESAKSRVTEYVHGDLEFIDELKGHFKSLCRRTLDQQKAA